MLQSCFNQQNPSINQAIHLLLMHSFFTLHSRLSQKLTTSTVTCIELSESNSVKSGGHMSLLWNRCFLKPMNP